HRVRETTATRMIGGPPIGAQSVINGVPCRCVASYIVDGLSETGRDMRAINAARTVIAGVAVLGLGTGCSDIGFSGSEPGTPTAAEPEMDNLLDPCTDIPDE